MRCVPSCEKCWMQVSLVPASDEVCPPVCASYEMCSYVSSTNLKCIMTFLLRERKDVLLEVAKELRVEIDITLPKIEFKKRICQSKYYDEESVKCLLGGILEERDQKFEERRLARELELERMRVQLRKKLNENKLKAGNRINDLANVCNLSENRITEVSEPVNKCRPLINSVVNKSVENTTSCDFEKKNCDPPVRCTNVSHPSEVGGKEFNVNRSSDCDVKMKVEVCEGRVKTVAMGAQRVIILDNIGDGSFELKRDKGVANPEGLICENSCEEKHTLGTLMGCEKQLTVDRESFRNHTIAKIAGQSNRTLPVVWLGRVNRYPYPRIKCMKYRNLNQLTRAEIYLLLKRESLVEKINAASWVTVLDLFLCAYDGCNLTTLILRLLEQIGVSRMVDIDILIQIWKNRVKKIDFVLKWLSRVGSEVGPTKGKLETWASLFRVDIM
ncbi:uncharacterized protein TNCV_3018101 [Trichonephila clavipes]|nr:uncharacterized protein TNCV_3018101 [Trichonephila clavipes]